MKPVIQVSTPFYIGVDVSKSVLDASDNLPGRKHSFANTGEGHRQLVQALRQLPSPVHVVCEATGGYHQAFTAALQESAIIVSVVNPRLPRNFAKAFNLLAKTDRIDCNLLAKYGAHAQPRPTPPSPEDQARFKALLDRRAELQVLISQEHNRQEHHQDKFVKKQAKTLRALLEKQLEDLDAEIAQWVESHEELAARVNRVTEISGVGVLTAWQVLAHMPELGALEDGQPGALAGVAPFNQDSGQHRGERHIVHGRFLVRRALYMAALAAARSNPVLKPFYQGLRLRGKPAKVALTAVMRKLIELMNKLLRDPSKVLQGPKTPRPAASLKHAA